LNQSEIEKLNPEMVAAVKARTTSRFSSLREPGNRSQTAAEQIPNQVNYSDVFHKTRKLPGSLELVPYSTRNYDWSLHPQHAEAIPELEQHIVELRKKRQQLSNEAETVRDWLSEQEAEFYNRRPEITSDKEVS